MSDSRNGLRIYDGVVHYPISSEMSIQFGELLEYIQNLRQRLVEAESRAGEAKGYVDGHNTLYHSAVYTTYNEDLFATAGVDAVHSNQFSYSDGEAVLNSATSIDDFEGALNWTSEDVSKIVVSLDATEFYQGTHSLALDWDRVVGVSEGFGAFFNIPGPAIPVSLLSDLSFYARATDPMTIKFLISDGSHFATSPSIQVGTYWSKVELKVSDFVNDTLFNGSATRLYLRVADVTTSASGSGRLNIDNLQVRGAGYTFTTLVNSVPATSTNVPLDSGFVQVGATNQYLFTTANPAVIPASLIISVNLSVLGAQVVTDDGAGNLVSGVPGVLDPLGANSVDYVTGGIDITFGEAIVAPPPANPTCTYDYMAITCTTPGPATIRVVFTPLFDPLYPASLEVTSGAVGTSTLTCTAWGVPLLSSGPNTLRWECQPTAVTTSGWLKATLRLFNAADPGMYVDIPAQKPVWVDDSTIGAWQPLHFVYSSYTSNLNAGTPLDLTLVTDIALILEHQFVGTVVFSELSEGSFPQLQFNQEALGALGAIYAIMGARKKVDPGVNFYADAAFAVGAGTPSFDLLCDKTAAAAQENVFNLLDMVESDYVTAGGEAIVRFVSTGFARIQGFTMGWRNHP